MMVNIDSDSVLGLIATLAFLIYLAHGARR